MRRIKLGEPLHPEITGFEEGLHYNYTAGGHTLTLSKKNPDLSEIYDVRKGQAVFALGLAQEALFLVAKFGDRPWEAAHYNWWINPPIMRPDPENDLLGLDRGLSLSVCLVNAANGLVEALRAVRLCHEFSCSLLKIVELQTRHPFDLMRYLDVVERASGRFRDDSCVVTNTICLCIGDFVYADHVTGRMPRVCH